MKKCVLSAMLFLMALCVQAKIYTLTSPNGRLSSTINVQGNTTFTLSTDRQQVLLPSPIAMRLNDGTIWGENMKVRKATATKVDRKSASPFYKRAEIEEKYNQLQLSANGYSIVFRMYDDGLAYRFEGETAGAIIVENEKAEYNFADDYEAFLPYIINRAKDTSATIEQQLWNDQQCQFTLSPLSAVNPDNLVAAPLTLNLNHGEKLCFAEADQLSYPGIYLLGDGAKHQMRAFFPQYPKAFEQGGHGNVEMLVTEREGFIAKCDGNRHFPWRSFMVTTNAASLVESDMVYRLSTPSCLTDTSWIKPGKVAWDWWNNMALSGVDFQAGMNTATYKYFIDFAQRYHLEYILIDEGWFSTKSTDIFDVVGDLDLDEILRYAKAKGVGVMLWTGYLSLARDLEKAISHYAAKGVKGFKIDFLNRDDQPMLDFMEQTARLCAEHHMLVDFHGTGKPAGLHRAYPNIVNYEAVFGLEQMRWSKKDVDMVTHDVTLPFTRMMAGPIDYTPGAMRNSLRNMYYPNKRNPMSQGTRCHQIAEYIVFDAPLTMLSDSPSIYMKEDECTRFIAKIPTVWDDTRVLAAEIGKYIVTAHKKGNRWFIGALNGWEPVELRVALPKECAGQKLEVMADGINADKTPEDYKHNTIAIAEDGTINIRMAAGGGWAAMTTNDADYQPIKFEEECRFHAHYANQAVAVDDNFFYAIQNNHISKFTLSGDSVTTWHEPDKQLIRHINSGFIQNGLMYCAHSNYPKTPMASSIQVFDLETMQMAETISLGIGVGSATWVLPGDDCWYVFFANYDKNGGEAGHDASWSQLVQYDRQWRRQQAWILPDELIEEIRPTSLSGAVMIDGRFYCTGHNNGRCYVLQFPPYGMRMQWIDTIDVPFDGQGIALDNDGNMWGINRKQHTVIKALRK